MGSQSHQFCGSLDCVLTRLRVDNKEDMTYFQPNGDDTWWLNVCKVLPSAMIDASDSKCCMENEQNLPSVSKTSLHLQSITRSAYPSKHSEPIIPSKRPLDAKTTIRPQPNSESSKTQEKRVYGQDLRPTPCRHYSHGARSPKQKCRRSSMGLDVRRNGEQQQRYMPVQYGDRARDSLVRGFTHGC